MPLLSDPVLVVVAAPDMKEPIVLARCLDEEPRERVLSIVTGQLKDKAVGPLAMVGTGPQVLGVAFGPEGSTDGE